MKIRSLTLAAICIAAWACASSALAEPSATLSGDDTATVFGSATLTALQDVGGSANTAAPSVSAGIDALRGASGNIGVNLAAGALNTQANQIALITTPQASIDTVQNVHAFVSMSGGAIAELGARALTGVSGNAGVNMAGGVANAQVNALVVH